MAQQVLINALARLLRPLVRILLRQGLSADAFEEVARRVYVDVAQRDFAIEGKKQTTSRIGVLTGLNRKEVSRLLKEPIADGSTLPATHNRAQRVLTSWLRDEDFLDRKGDPLPLPFTGDGATFSELARRYSGDMPARAVADELIRVNALEEAPDGTMTMVSRGYVPDSSSEELITYLGVHVSDLLGAFDYNMTRGDDQPRFQRQLSYRRIPEEDVQEFRSHSARLSQRLLEDLDRWLAERQLDDSDSEPTVTLGLGIYEVETWPSEQDRD